MSHFRELAMLGSAIAGLAICLVLADQLGQNWIAFIGVGLLGLALVFRELTIWGSPRNAAVALGVLLAVVAGAFIAQRLIV